MPPKGRRGSDLTSPFTNTEPASTSGARRSARSRLAVQRDAPSPKVESFARRMASSSSRAPTTAATGPKVLVEDGHPLVDGGQDGGRVEGAGAARHAPA